MMNIQIISDKKFGKIEWCARKWKFPNDNGRIFLLEDGEFQAVGRCRHELACFGYKYASLTQSQAVVVSQNTSLNNTPTTGNYATIGTGIEKAAPKFCIEIWDEDFNFKVPISLINTTLFNSEITKINSLTDGGNAFIWWYEGEINGQN